jgi:DNA end-binding protein Ku
LIIPITDEDLASLPLPTARTIEIVGFVPASSIDPLQMESAYYLSANGVLAARSYTLLREALRRSQKVAIAKFALRGRERLGMLRVVEDVITMHALLWPDEIRAPEGAAPETEVSLRKTELDLADTLVDTLGEVGLDSLHDDYRAAVEALIAAKAEGGGVAPETTPAERGGDRVIDLMTALKNSVRAAKEARGEVAEVTSIKGRGRAAAAPKPSGAGGGAKKSTARKAAAAKKAAKKTTAKKAAKKATAKKSTPRKRSSA